MSLAVFVGPTLPRDALDEFPEVRILPPVRQGDVYRVAKDRPSAIGIIDGYFEGVPSVWHKEILWALEQGIPVFGSASMGALRAAELADFGMIGVGQIFEDYVAGVLQDDDEVAVVHSPAELGYQSLSVPMVSVRASVSRAETVGVIEPETAARIIDAAKSIHYRDRNWPDIENAVTEHAGTEDFFKWLPKGQVDAKAEDAKAMLRMMFDYLSDPPAPQTSTVRAERTLVWKTLRNRIDAEATEGDAVIDELRLTPELYFDLRARAVLRLLAQEEADRIEHSPDREVLLTHMSDHRNNAGLSRKADLMQWLRTNDLNPELYEAMLTGAAQIDAVTEARSTRLNAPLLTELKRSGRYADLRDRADKKTQLVAPSDRKISADRLHMLIWFFETNLDRDVPDDLESYAVSLGLSGRDALYDLIEAEFLYCHSDTGSTA
ncbi:MULTISPECIES: TfuA-like protein [unclassified Ruegeria]|uniref:TfuA-like protein n=1 Tax=unclassified Ruegeria TaxID=2625375 RepID=UPI001488C223|nr:MULTISPECIES: TfuA-like protein [unclassified Ruegeria]